MLKGIVIGMITVIGLGLLIVFSGVLTPSKTSFTAESSASFDALKSIAKLEIYEQGVTLFEKHDAKWEMYGMSLSTETVWTFCKGNIVFGIDLDSSKITQTSKEISVQGRLKILRIYIDLKSLKEFKDGGWFINVDQQAIRKGLEKIILEKYAPDAVQSAKKYAPAIAENALSKLAGKPVKIILEGDVLYPK